MSATPLNALEITAHVARRLREARAGAGLSQKEVAISVSVGQSTLSFWESADRRVGIAELVTLARVLNRPLAFFLDFEKSAAVEERAA